VNICIFDENEQLSRRELGQATNASIGLVEAKWGGDSMHLSEGRRKDGKKDA